ncbi:undecaprenyl-diphosphatase, partial [Candidatus Dojkabacteria bacterium]|nr:undecaprenyl-diphosphatase [Candidatus Dojkabacteria bacterium]
MTIIQSLILGIIQGVTEFLPISSSAHLVIIPRFFGWEEHTTAFDAMLHAGTLFATVIYFRKDLIKLITDRNYKLIGFFALA